MRSVARRLCSPEPGYPNPLAFDGPEAYKALRNTQRTTIDAQAGAASGTAASGSFTPTVTGKVRVSVYCKGTSSADTATTTFTFTIGATTLTRIVGPSTAPGTGSFATQLDLDDVVSGLAVGTPAAWSLTWSTAGGNYGPDGEGAVNLQEQP